MRLRALFVLISMAGGAACTSTAGPGSKASAPMESPQPAPAAPVTPESLGWLPAETGMVARMRPDSAALVLWVSHTLKDNRPECLQAQVATLDSTFQVTHGIGGGEKAANVAHGKLDRDAFEQCVGQVFERLGLPLTFQRQGPLTQVTSFGDQRTYLGWSEDGYVIWHDDRERVEQFLSARVGLSGNPGLAPLRGRVEPDAMMWLISSVDMTSRPLGVPSRGFFYSIMKLSPDSTRLPVTVLFDSAAQATEAARVLREKAQDTTMPEGLRSALVAMNPSVRDAEIEVDLLTFFRDPSAARGLAELLSGSKR